VSEVAVSQPTGTVTLLFSDIEGSTRLLQQLGPSRYAAALDLHRRLLREAFGRHGGYEVDCEGDAFFVAFESAVEAATAAAEGQEALADAEWPTDGEIRVRMGIHTGEPLAVSPKYVGLDVHKAARIMAAGHGGQVLVSEAARRLLKDVETVPLGEHRLKDLLQPEPLHQLVVPGLATEFPALKTLGNRPTNLPVQPTALIGREHELTEITALLAGEERTRLVTLTGPGGTGKTRLSLHAAAELLEGFASGVFFVSLAPLADAELVLPAIAGALSLRETSGESLDDTVASYLAEKQLLLVLDNFEHVIAAAGSVADLLERCPGVCVLATSREPLRLRGESIYPVPPLQLPDAADELAALAANEAVALFVERASTATGAFALTAENARDVAAVCTHVEGLPLAIELAAAWVPTLPPSKLRERLGSRLATLTRGARDADERQRTLRATIEWSFDLLTLAERAIFACLAVFVDGCTLEAAEAVCEPFVAGDALDGLASLVEKSLVRRRDGPDGESRYWMFETIRELAAERLASDLNRSAVAGRHLDHYLSLAERLEPEVRGARQAHALDLLSADQANLRAAFSWGVDRGRGDAAARLAVALLEFHDIRGTPTEVRGWYERCLACPGLDPDLEAWLLFGEALSAWRQTDLDAALRGTSEAARRFEAAGDRRGLVRALSNLAWLDYEAGRDGEGRASAKRAMTLADSLGDAWLRAFATAAVAQAERDDRARAADLFAESARLFHLAGDVVNAAASFSNAAVDAFLAGDRDGVDRLLASAIDMARSAGALRILAAAVNNRAHAALVAGRLEDARTDVAEALQILSTTGDRRGIQESLELAAAVLVGDGEFESAAMLLGAAEAAFSSAASHDDNSELRSELVSELEQHLSPARMRELRLVGASRPLDAVVDAVLTGSVAESLLPA
jgi:predicted ATPase/class 3 adenylate cyclase